LAGVLSRLAITLAPPHLLQRRRFTKAAIAASGLRPERSKSVRVRVPSCRAAQAAQFPILLSLACVALCQNAEAVVLDFVNPAWAGRRRLGSARQARVRCALPGAATHATPTRVAADLRSSSNRRGRVRRSGRSNAATVGPGSIARSVLRTDNLTQGVQEPPADVTAAVNDHGGDL
jgi:hypothetical protein